MCIEKRVFEGEVEVVKGKEERESGVMKRQEANEEIGESRG